MAERNRSTPLQGSSHYDLNTDKTDQYLKIALPEDNEQVLAGNFAPRTYVVKVPIDQIYRVQPKKNDGKFDTHYQELSQTKKDPCRTFCCCFCALLMLLFLLTVVGAVLSALFSILLRPKDPRFSVHRLQLKNTSKPHDKPQYELDLEVDNPNPNVQIFYGNGGEAYLSSRQLEIASGGYPVFTQKSKNTAMVKIVLKGFSNTLPEEVQSSVTNKKDKVHVTFSLEMKLLMRMMLGLLHSATMGLNIHCQIIVDTLAEDTRILSNKCDHHRG